LKPRIPAPIAGTVFLAEVVRIRFLFRPFGHLPDSLRWIQLEEFLQVSNAASALCPPHLTEQIDKRLSMEAISAVKLNIRPIILL
jgi:hypothetical protein